MVVRRSRLIELDALVKNRRMEARREQAAKTATCASFAWRRRRRSAMTVSS
jgi:hypothetical protein